VPTHFIEESKLPEFLLGIDTAAAYAQTAREEGSDIERLNAAKPVPLGLRKTRAPLSVKSFLFPVKERVAVYRDSCDAWRQVERVDFAETIDVPAPAGKGTSGW